MIHDLKARLANNNVDFNSELQEYITFLEEAAEEASWTIWRQSEEFRQLEKIVDCPISCETSRNCKLRFENCRLSAENWRLSDEVGTLQFQINDMRASCPAAGVNNYLTDDNLSLFPSFDDDGSN